jgi:hypothetical protein
MANKHGLFVKRFKSLAPGRADGGIFNLASTGGQGIFYQ